MGYFLAFESYQLGNFLFFGAAFGIGQIIALLLLAGAVWAVVRKPSGEKITVHAYN